MPKKKQPKRPKKRGPGVMRKTPPALMCSRCGENRAAVSDPEDDLFHPCADCLLFERASMDPAARTRVVAERKRLFLEHASRNKSPGAKDELAWLKDPGWFAHHVYPSEGDPDDLMPSFHTHGLLPLLDHPDLEVYAPIPGELAQTILNDLAGRVIAGERLEPGRDVTLRDIRSRVTGQPMPVRLLYAREQGGHGQPRWVLRAILPDEQGNLDRDLLADPLVAQYVGVR